MLVSCFFFCSVESSLFFVLRDVDVHLSNCYVLLRPEARGVLIILYYPFLMFVICYILCYVYNILSVL